MVDECETKLGVLLASLWKVATTTSSFGMSVSVVVLCGVRCTFVVSGRGLNHSVELFFKISVFVSFSVKRNPLPNPRTLTGCRRFRQKYKKLFTNWKQLEKETCDRSIWYFPSQIDLERGILAVCERPY